MMRFLLCTLSLLLGATARSGAQGFTESDVVFYGEVRKSAGGQTVLLQAGELAATFVNQSDPANTVTLRAAMKPTGGGTAKPYSYALRVPLAYLPEASRKTEFLSVGSQPTSFRIEQISVDGVPATLPDGSRDLYGLDFASRSHDFRLDLLVAGESTDGDHDGLPDWWERVHRLDEHLADASGDPDEDGWSNLEEFRRGGDPNQSNRSPQLVTAEILVPETGTAGVYLQILDSDTAAEDIRIDFPSAGTGGFDLKLDGAVASGFQLTLAGIQRGRLAVAHSDRAERTGSVRVAWSDGGEPVQGEIVLVALAPSATDASEATLWLDGRDLPADGARISSWPDRSGWGRDASQPLADFQPVAAGEAADFGMSPDAHLFFQDAAIPAGDHTVVAAYRAEPSADAAQTLLATNRGFLRLESSGQPVSYPGSATYQIDGGAARGFETATGIDATSIFRRKAGLLSNIFGQGYDGESVSVAPIEPVLPTLGARRSAIPSGGDPLDEGFAGRLRELLVFPTALPEQKLRRVNDYLESKWGGAEVWDFSTEFRAVDLAPSAGARSRIIRGGFASDRLAGGDGADVLSGGDGDDVLSGGGGSDRFLFGEVDLGRDLVADFDPEEDILDLSALFWGLGGDARDYVSVRLDTNFSTPVPTIDSTLIIERPGGGTREIVLRDTVIGATQLARLIVEGHLRMGALTIPSTVQLALVSSSAVPLPESLDASFTVRLTRSGAGVPAALEIPVGLFEQALGGRFLVEGAAASEGARSVVRFERGETSRTLVVRPVPDLVSRGLADVRMAILPQYKFSVAGSPVEQTVSDQPLVWIELLEANASVEPRQHARILIHREGDLSGALVVDLAVGGTGLAAVEPLPASLTLPAGQASLELAIAAQSGALTSGGKVVELRLAPSDRYLAGAPNAVVVYVGNTASEAQRAGFDRWITTFTEGAITGLTGLASVSRERRDTYLQAYAFNLDSGDAPGSRRLGFRIVHGRPEISVAGNLDRADLRWTIQETSDFRDWREAAGHFVPSTTPESLVLTGPPLQAGDLGRFYRLQLALDPGLSAGSALIALTGSEQYAFAGGGTWTADPASGELNGGGGTPGQPQRIIVSASNSTDLDFEMAIADGAPAASFAFFIDGVKHSETTGVAVRVQVPALAAGTLLMWEFTGEGQALIRNLP